MRKIIGLFTGFILITLLFSQCRKTRDTYNGEPVKMGKPCSTHVNGLPAINLQVDEVAKFIASFTHYIHPNYNASSPYFTEVLYNNLDIYDEQDFKTLSQVSALTSLTVTDHYNVPSQHWPNYNFTGLPFGWALEKQNEAVNRQINMQRH